MNYDETANDGWGRFPETQETNLGPAWEAYCAKTDEAVLADQYEDEGTLWLVV